VSLIGSMVEGDQKDTSKIEATARAMDRARRLAPAIAMPLGHPFQLAAHAEVTGAQNSAWRGLPAPLRRPRERARSSPNDGIGPQRRLVLDRPAFSPTTSCSTIRSAIETSACRPCGRRAWITAQTEEISAQSDRGRELIAALRDDGVGI
jgi:hypothetical protein